VGAFLGEKGLEEFWIRQRSRVVNCGALSALRASICRLTVCQCEGGRPPIPWSEMSNEWSNKRYSSRALWGAKHRGARYATNAEMKRPTYR